MTLTRWREPALALMSVLAPAVQTALLLWAHLTDEQQAAANAAAVAFAGLGVAAIAARDRLAPTLLGFGQAVIALATVFGWHLDAVQSTAVSSLLALVVGVVVRAQVTAPVDALGQPVPRTPITRGRHERPEEAA